MGNSCTVRNSCWLKIREDILRLNQKISGIDSKDIDAIFSIPVGAGGFGTVWTNTEGSVVLKKMRKTTTQFIIDREINVQLMFLGAIQDWQADADRCDPDGLTVYIPIPLKNIKNAFAMERVQPIKGIPETMESMVHLYLSNGVEENKLHLVNSDRPATKDNIRGFFVTQPGLERFLLSLHKAGYQLLNAAAVCETMGNVYGILILKHHYNTMDMELVLAADKCPNNNTAPRVALWIMDFGFCSADTQDYSLSSIFDQTFTDGYVPTVPLYLAYFLRGFLLAGNDFSTATTDTIAKVAVYNIRAGLGLDCADEVIAKYSQTLSSILRSGNPAIEPMQKILSKCRE